MHPEKKNLNPVYMVLTSELILKLTKDFKVTIDSSLNHWLSVHWQPKKPAKSWSSPGWLLRTSQKGCHFAAIQKLCCMHTKSRVSFCSLSLKEGCSGVGDSTEKDSENGLR